MKRDAKDAKFSKSIRERDKFTCQRCGTKHHPKSQGLHSAHCFSRGKQSTRFDPENAMALCYGCHAYADQHKETVLYPLFRARLGDEAFEALRLRSNMSRKALDAMTLRLAYAANDIVDATYHEPEKP